MLLIAFLFVACGDEGADNPLAVERQGAVQWLEGQTIVALGTSLTFGFGAGCKVFPFDRDCALPDSSYPATLASRLQLPVVNLGFCARGDDSGRFPADDRGVDA